MNVLQVQYPAKSSDSSYKTMGKKFRRNEILPKTPDINNVEELSKESNYSSVLSLDSNLNGENHVMKNILGGCSFRPYC